MQLLRVLHQAAKRTFRCLSWRLMRRNGRSALARIRTLTRSSSLASLPTRVLLSKARRIARTQCRVLSHLQLLHLFAFVDAVITSIAGHVAPPLPCTNACACVTSLTLAAIPTTVCTKPESALMPICAPSCRSATGCPS